MEKQENLYHVYSKSEKILFRSEEDYYMGINRLAASAQVTGTQVWAFALMSTHFHLVVKTADVRKFVGCFKRHVALHYLKQYGPCPAFVVSYKEIANNTMAQTVVNYVLKNPVHHKVVKFPTRYPYTSIGCYFTKLISPLPLIPPLDPPPQLMVPSQLPWREQRALFGTKKMPDSYQILRGKVVLPQCFIDFRSVHKLYYGVRDFVYHMSRPIDEEVNLLGAKSEEAEGPEAADASWGRLDDLEACRLIDQNARFKAYTQLPAQEQKDIERQLMRLGLDRGQIKRAM